MAHEIREPLSLTEKGSFDKSKPLPLNVNGTNDKANTEPKKLKPCCACPETKKIRDECIIEKGEENCKHLIEAHKACMRELGFNI